MRTQFYKTVRPWRATAELGVKGCLVLSALTIAACTPGAARSGDTSEGRNATMSDTEWKERLTSGEYPVLHEKGTERPASGGEAVATFGGGCFWCVEAVFEQMEGVKDVVSGYAGGHTENPTYGQVCAGDTGHAEVVRITYDPSVVSYGELLEMFWKSHNPTTPNRQGADVGSQYRSIILYQDEEQKRVAEQSKRKGKESGGFSDPIVTEIVPAGEFYEAEGYHQDYSSRNSNAPYCQAVIAPKLKKLDM